MYFFVFVNFSFAHSAANVTKSDSFIHRVHPSCGTALDPGPALIDICGVAVMTLTINADV